MDSHRDCSFQILQGLPIGWASACSGESEDGASEFSMRKEIAWENSEHDLRSVHKAK